MIYLELLTYIRLLNDACSLMYATAAGIGSFLAFIGLQGSQGLGVIGYDSATLVALAGCPPDEQV
jgi:AGZA family xanthine/uracil permease-like MFS transporter